MLLGEHVAVAIQHRATLWSLCVCYWENASPWRYSREQPSGVCVYVTGRTRRCGDAAALVGFGSANLAAGTWFASLPPVRLLCF